MCRGAGMATIFQPSDVRGGRSRQRFIRFFWRALVFSGDEEDQAHAGADRGGGDVEGGGGAVPAVATAQLDVKAYKVHDFAAEQSVGEIAGNAAKDEAKSDLADQGMGIEMVAGQEQGDER